MLKRMASTMGLLALTTGVMGGYAAAPISLMPTSVDGSSMGAGRIDLTAPRQLPSRIVINDSKPTASLLHTTGSSASCTATPGTTEDRWIPQPAGCTRSMTLFYGPYVINPGSDLSRPYLEVPVNSGFLSYVHPSLRLATDPTQKPDHNNIHIHHAHWFQVQAANNAENYGTLGTNHLNWVFGTGQEETAASVEDRSRLDPQGFTYGKFVDGNSPQLLIYMIHNETAQAQSVYMTLEVHFTSGTHDAIVAAGGPAFHDLAGILIGDTFDVPRNFSNPLSTFAFPYDAPGTALGIEGNSSNWVSDTDGVLIGIGGHLHMGGYRDVVENMGSTASPCPNDGLGVQGGTTLVYSDSVVHDNADPSLATRAPSLMATPTANPRFPSEDFQMATTPPTWRAPIHKGDVIRVNGVYENGSNAWYYVMNHIGFYIDRSQSPTAGCAPYLVNNPTASRQQVIASVPNRPWDAQQDWCGTGSGNTCGVNAPWNPTEINTPVVHIAGFTYVPGDLNASVQTVPVVKQGSSLTFVNDDQALGSVRHTITTCAAPCDGPDYANYPSPDGVLDSNTLGKDWIDGGTENPAWSSPTGLAAGDYFYFCRIHPWMRGSFRVTPAA